MTTTGPTLNASYNYCLVSWAADGSPALPECEDCGKDLTGEEVICTGYGWVCTCCAKTNDECFIDVGYREDFHSDG